MSFEENLGIFYEPEKEGVEKFEMNEKIEMLQKENIELKKKVEKLKCCGNCGNPECYRVDMFKMKLLNTDECTTNNHKFWKMED